MADDITLTSGKVVAGDDIGGVIHQRVKISQGSDGSATDVSSASPLAVWTPRVVSQSPVIVDPGSIVDDLLAQDGTPVVFNAAVDASGTGGLQWELRPATGDHYILHQLVIHVMWAEVTTDVIDTFGAAGALSTGIEIRVNKLSDDTELYELTQDLTIKRLSDLAWLCGQKVDVVSNSDSPQKHQAVFQLNFPNPLLIQEPINDGSYLQVDLNDDLSGLTELYFRVRGYKLDAAAFATQYVHLVN